MELAGAALFAVLGTIMGSFLNVCADRLPAGGSLLRPPSRCVGCGYRLKPHDMVPVISYLWLRGRCRKCGARIPRRVLVVEAGTGLMFAFLWWRFGPSVLLGVAGAYSCILTVVTVTDIEHGLIPNKVVYPALGLGLSLAALQPEPGIVRAVAGGAAGMAVIVLIIAAFKGGMGWGDSKLAAFTGLVTGFPAVFLALLISVVTGGAMAVALLVTRRRGRKDTMPFGPFLAFGTWAVMIYGREILELYYGWVGQLHPV